MKKYFLLLFLSIPLISISQWQATKGPYGGNVQTFYESNNLLYAGTTAGLFVSSDNADNWKFIDIGFPANITAIAEMNGRIFIGTTEKGVVCSSDNGISWQKVNTGLSTQYQCGYCIRGFSVNGNEIFTATESGLYKIKNADTTWTFIASGFFDTFSGKGLTMISSEQARYGPGCNSEITTDGGLSFRPLVFPDTSSSCSNFSCSFDISSCGILAVADDYLYLSKDDGYSWTSIYHDTADHQPTMVKVIDDKIYLATQGKGLLVSSTDPISWTNTGLLTLTISTVYKFNHMLFAGTGFNRGVFKSDISDYNWTEKNNGLSAVKISCIESYDRFVIAGCNGGIRVSADSGHTWKKIDLRLPGKPLDKDNDFFIKELATNGKIIMAGADLFYKNVFISRDSGTTWAIMNQPLQEEIAGLAIIGNRLIVCTWFKFYYSDDFGQTWNTAPLPTGNDLCWDLKYDAQDLYTLSMNAIYVSHNGGTVWDSLPGPQSSIYNSMKLVDSLLLVVDGLDGLFTAPKNGSSWFHSYVNNPNNFSCNYNIGTVHTDVFISDNRALPGLMHSTDLGHTWSTENIFINHYVEQLGSSKDYAYASTPGFGIWRYAARDLILESKEYSDETNFLIYPNPTTGIFTIKLNQLSDAELSVYDLSGKCIYDRMFMKSINETLDLRSKPKGVYLIEIIAHRKKSIKKIVLN